MSNTAQHMEWRSLIEISGPFLAASVLESAFPQGLDAVETPRRQKLRAAYEEWRDAVNEEDPLLPQLHQEWIRLVLTDLLEYDSESLISAADWAGDLPSVSSQENTGTFSPDWIIHAPGDEKARLFISIFPPDTNLESSGQNDGWPASLLERMTLLCRAHGVRLGLLSNGERWMLVNAPEGSTSGQASWYARLWFQEPLTLKAFRSLLGVRRCFGPAETTLEALLEESLKHQEEVTDTLGAQVRRAVEVLIQCLDKADEDRNRELLRDVSPAELYEAGLTIMMRLVFILCAEERGLLLSGDPLYDQCYAVSTLRGQLSGETPEILDRRHDAWARLLAIFRGVYGGIEHQDLRLPALGGSLFDPDRFPFLEGRTKGTRWRDVPASPLPIDNRTVLLLLNSLQILEQSTGALLLSYRALDVEQIGHVYEGLLEHTVARVPKVTLGLQGTQSAKDPNIPLAELESVHLDGEADLVKRIREVTGRSESAIKNDLKKEANEHLFSKVIGVCGSDMELAERIRPFTNLLRTDAWEDPIIYRANSFMVTLGADRRETGTHYTPKSLTERIVSTTLEPLVYSGPSEGKPQEEWVLKTPQEILDLKVCDPAMGSGAFLVQACRYLGERLVEAWLHAEKNGKKVTIDGETCDRFDGAEPMPSLKDERLTIAKRLVAERCLYGVDINPLAVELAKLSIWLITLGKGRPFGFLDHNLRSGDSLLGIHKIEQLTYMTMVPESEQYQLRIFGQEIESVIQKAVDLRKQIRATLIRDIHNIENMAHLNLDARKCLNDVVAIADGMIGEVVQAKGNSKNINIALDRLAIIANEFLIGDIKAESQLRNITNDFKVEQHLQLYKFNPFHWPLEFPEVILGRGFDCIIGNPPFMGGQKITGNFSTNYRKYLVKFVANGFKGSADLCAYFFLRMCEMLRRDGGALGFLATNTIAQGDTREVGLGQLTTLGLKIIAAEPSIPWPGKAALEVALVWLWRGRWGAKSKLNNCHYNAISSFLRDAEIEALSPKLLPNNKNLAFMGSIPLGAGFLLAPEQAQNLIATDGKNSNVLRPYLSGDDLLSRPDQTPSRWVIDFGDLALDAARQYEKPFDIVEKYVKPVREKDKRKVRRERWWQFAERSPALYKNISHLKRVLFHSFTSKYIAFSFVDSNQSFAGPHIVVATDSYGMFAVLQSSMHEAWARNWCSTHETRLRYAISDLLFTFPFPEIHSELIKVGECYHDYRKSIMLKYDEGLTKIYNRVHDINEISQDVIRIRELQKDMDYAVWRSYGFEAIDFAHDFYETKQGIRYSISPTAISSILSNLLILNNKLANDM